MHHALGVRLQLVLHDRSVLEPKMLEKLTAREVTVSGLDVVERSDVAWMDRFNHLVAESLVHFVIRALRAAIFLPLMRSRGVWRVDWCWSRLDWWNKRDVSSRQVVVDCRCHRESEVTKDAVAAVGRNGHHTAVELGLHNCDGGVCQLGGACRDGSQRLDRKRVGNIGDGGCHGGGDGGSRRK